MSFINNKQSCCDSLGALSKLEVFICANTNNFADRIDFFCPGPGDAHITDPITHGPGRSCNFKYSYMILYLTTTIFIRFLNIIRSQIDFRRFLAQIPTTFYLTRRRHVLSGSRARARGGTREGERARPERSCALPRSRGTARDCRATRSRESRSRTPPPTDADGARRYVHFAANK